MDPLIPAKPKESRLAAMGKDLVRGLAIGLGIYVVWVVIHMILFGMLGD